MKTALRSFGEWHVLLSTLLRRAPAHTAIHRALWSNQRCNGIPYDFQTLAIGLRFSARIEWQLMKHGRFATAGDVKLALVKFARTASTGLALVETHRSNSRVCAV